MKVASFIVGVAITLFTVADAGAASCLQSGRAKFCPGGVLDMGAGGKGTWKANAKGVVTQVCFPKHGGANGLDCRPPRGPKVVIPWLKK